MLTVIPLLAQGGRLWRCNMSSAIWRIPAVALAQSGRLQVTRRRQIGRHVNISATPAINNDSMRILAACFVILALSRTALASDVQVGDHVLAIYDGIGCSDWTSFESFVAPDKGDPRRLKGELPAGCQIIHGAPPTPLAVDAVDHSAEAVCIRLDKDPPPASGFRFAG